MVDSVTQIIQSDRKRLLYRGAAWMVLGICMLSEAVYSYHVRRQWGAPLLITTVVADMIFPVFYWWRAAKFSSPILAAIPALFLASIYGLYALGPYGSFDGPGSDPMAVSLLTDLYFFFIVYGSLRAIKWMVESIRAAFSKQVAPGMKWRAVLIPTTALAGVAIMIHIGNAGPRYASRAHDRIHVGMSANDVVGILTAGQQDFLYPLTIHSFTITALGKNEIAACEKTRPSFDACFAGDWIKKFDCEKKFPQFGYPAGSCVGIHYDAKEFLRVLDHEGHQTHALWKARIDADFHGPIFMNNTFQIDFDEKGTATSVSPIQHRD